MFVTISHDHYKERNEEKKLSLNSRMKLFYPQR